MLAHPAYVYEISALADSVSQRGLLVQLRPQLIEIRHGEFSAQLYFTLIRPHLTQYDFEQCAFARAIRAQEANLVAALNTAGKITDDIAPTKAFTDVAEFSHQFAGAVPAFDIHLNLANAFPPCGAFPPQLFQPAHPALIAHSARLDALAYPHLLLRQHLVEFRVKHRLILQHGFLGTQISAKIAGETGQLAAVQFDDAGRHIVQEASVMGDKQHTAAEIAEQAFQPFDRRKIQVVGRLVQNQHIGLGHQRLRQRHALAHAAGQIADAAVRIQLQTLNRRLYTRLHGPAILRLQPCLQGLHVLQQAVVIGVRLGQLVRYMMIVV